jgi:DNA modification methylase
MRSGQTGASELLRAMRGFLGDNDMMAYLAMMAIRLIELHRVLKPTGSLYLHCDPTASHYLKLLLDAVFGKENYVNEVVWKRSDSHNDAGQGASHFGRIHDVIFRYRASEEAVFNQQYTPLPQKTVEKWYRHIEEGTGRRYNKGDVTAPGGADPKKRNPHYEWNGLTRYWRYSKQRMQEMQDQGRLVYSGTGMTYQKRYLDESKGIPLQDWWDDIAMLRGIHGDGERLGYPTQKPVRSWSA